MSTLYNGVTELATLRDDGAIAWDGREFHSVLRLLARGEATDEPGPQGGRRVEVRQMRRRRARRGEAAIRGDPSRRGVPRVPRTPPATARSLSPAAPWSWRCGRRGTRRTRRRGRGRRREAAAARRRNPSRRRFRNPSLRRFRNRRGTLKRRRRRRRRRVRSARAARRPRAARSPALTARTGTCRWSSARNTRAGRSRGRRRCRPRRRR